MEGRKVDEHGCEETRVYGENGGWYEGYLGFTEAMDMMKAMKIMVVSRRKRVSDIKNS